MSARLVLVLGALFCGACAENPRAPVQGLSPEATARPGSVPAEPRTTLSAPPADPAPAAAAPAPAEGVPAMEVADFGPIDLLTWDEARRRAQEQITAQNAAAELVKLRGELGNRP